ncbi:MAG: hypothetical protein M1832_003857 [Thelocarpon impressellum]|nr:MAG: hypothetical protein M1832_003857 [Thelocarpon impressellum]
MPLPGLLRRNRNSENDLRRRSVLLEPLAHLGQGLGHGHEDSAAQKRPSESSDTSAPRSSHRPLTPTQPVSAKSVPVSSSGNHLAPPTGQGQPTGSRNPIMKLRYASDSQLSLTAKQQAAARKEQPPVPLVPDTPAIITTAPTMETAQKSQKRRPRLKLSDRLKPTSDRTDGSMSSSDRSSVFQRRAKPDKGSLGNESMRGSRVTFSEPDRPSPGTSGDPPPYGDLSSSSLALPTSSSRLSESSRSDGSTGESVAYAATTTTTHTVSTTTTFFRLPRRKKAPAPLFPLPDKISASESAYTPARTPRASTSVAESAGHSPARHSGSLVSSPQPSPSLATPSASSMGLAGPVMPLARKNSTTSARSSRSSPSRRPPLRLGKRGRSSTMTSLNNATDDGALPTPPLPSGRTSTSTLGRSSLGGIFNRSHLFRPECESPYPRHGSPGTPGDYASKANSFNLARESLVIPEREADDTPAKYLTRVEEAVSRGVVASILSKSSDPFFQATLRSYMRSFAFFEDPMDMAIRKLLMELELPKETQQIDRVLQGFADRYHECNPGIYASSEQAYFIAFSLLILHTDVFNKNNKHKMLKPDYLKNTKGEGVSEDVLECFYDNISYTPFIHVEDDLDINGERIVAQKTRKAIFPRGSTEVAKRSPKAPVDPYTLIIDHKLDTLRPSLKDIMIMEDPFGYLGTATSLDLLALQNTFFKSGVLQIVSARSRPDAFKSPTTISNPDDSHPGVVDIKITKVGVLWRKDAKRKKARSPWQEWGAILTGAQLYFFKNTTWVKNLMHQYEAHHKQGHAGVPVVFKPPLENFTPEALLSTENAVALLDSSYKKHKHAFTFVRQGIFEETFLADNEKDMNDWLAKLNYAATFRTAGVRMRGVVAGNSDGQRNRAIRRLGTASSDQSGKSSNAEGSTLSGEGDPLLAQQVKIARRQIMSQKITEADEKLAAIQKRLDVQLRNARHLQILAPIQTKTREQVVVAAVRMAQQLRWIRVEMWRLKCHREILALDLDEEFKTAADLRPHSQHLATGSPPVAPTRDSSKGGLARFDSKSTTRDGPQRISRSSMGPQQPGEGPRDKQFGLEDIFQTPPELSRQSSYHKAQASWELPPLTFGPPNNQNGSSANLSLGERGQDKLAHQASASSLYETEQASDTVRLAAELPSVDNVEIEVLKEAGYVRPDGSSSGPPFDGPDEAGDAAEHTPTKTTEAESSDRSKVRRSLQRTIREAHVPAHHRSKKGKDASSGAAPAEDGASMTESEGLARGTGSFTVHGKKASVITFGSEWAGMSPEDRLRLRKQSHGDGTRLVVPGGGSDGSESTNRMSSLEPVDAASPRRNSEVRRSTMSNLAAIEDHGDGEASEVAVEDETPERHAQDA